MWPEQGGERLVIGADNAGEVGVLAVRQAESGILPKPFSGGLWVRGGPAALSVVLAAG